MTANNVVNSLNHSRESNPNNPSWAPSSHQPFSRLWLLSVLLLCGLFIGNGAVFYVAMDHLVQSEQKASNTKSMLRAIKDVFSSVQDAEIGLRGFLISGQDQQLQPYHQALENIEIHMTNLKMLNSESAMQSQRIQQLEELVLLKLSHLTSVLKNEERLRNGIADEGVSLFQGHEIMAQLRALVHKLVETEYQLLDKQLQQARESRRELVITIVVATATGLILIAIIAVLARREWRRQQQQAVYLEEKVAERTAELEHFSNELKRSNRELQDFAFVASHDLQEPLRKIRAFGDRLLTKYAPQLEDGADYVQRMQSAAERMSRLIEDLLEFSRVTTRAKPFQQVNLNDVLSDVLDDLQLAIEGSDAHIVWDTLPQLEADPTQMRQLLQNLIGNAIKFVAPGVAPEIHIQCHIHEADQDHDERDWCDIAVSDNGIGFDREHAERIFSPFRRLHGKGEYAGTGIGLAVCRRIVERHGGSIHAISQPSEGATFRIRLPLRQYQIHYSDEPHQPTE